MTDGTNKPKLHELREVAEKAPPEMQKRFHAGMQGKQLFERTHTIPDVINTREDFSEHAIDCMETFGINAAAVLNEYSCAVEDSFIQQIEKAREYQDAIFNMDILRKESELENALLKRRLRLIKDLISRKQLDDITEVMNQPL